MQFVLGGLVFMMGVYVGASLVKVSDERASKKAESAKKAG